MSTKQTNKVGLLHRELTLSTDDEKIVVDMDAFFSVYESTYIIDFQKQIFVYLSNHDLLFGEYSSDEIIQMGYGFYRKTVHPKDFPLLMKIFEEIRQKPDTVDSQNREVLYFSFAIRFAIYLKKKETVEYVNVHHKVIPIFSNGEIQRGICSLSLSESENSGNLRRYWNDNTFDVYVFKTEKWTTGQKEGLTKNEKIVMFWIMQGITHTIIAARLGITLSEVDMIFRRLRTRFNVNKNPQLITYVQNHSLLFSPAIGITRNRKKTKKMPKVTPSVLEGIQNCLNQEQAVNAIAKRYNISEKYIRVLIKKGKLSKKEKK
ncbi:MAG: LuxR C-terminal-related transcriptional regulator [Prevotellaceae bacterium]|jgi:DNA-binding CsgD family transcriptional regulator|nr:LuxR C-terminal-related transcriptional regulator [Prevotellaceae bacterium]